MKYLIAIVLAVLCVAGWEYGTQWVTHEMVSYHDGSKYECYLSMPRWRWALPLPTTCYDDSGNKLKVTFRFVEDVAIIDPSKYKSGR